MQNVRGEKNAVGGCQTLISSSLKPLSPDQIQLSVWSSGAETSPGEVCSRDGTETKSEAQSFYNSRGCHVKGTVHCMETLMFVVLTRPQSKPHAERTNRWQWGFIIFWWTVPLSISLKVTTDINTFVSSTFLRHAGQLLLAHLPEPVVCAVTHAVHEHSYASTPPPFCSLLYGPQSVTSPPSTTYISPWCSHPSLPKNQNDVNISRKLILSSD